MYIIEFGYCQNWIDIAIKIKTMVTTFAPLVKGCVTDAGENVGRVRGGGIERCGVTLHNMQIG